MIKQYLHNIIIWLDQGLNTFTGGDPDETVSSRLGKAHRGDFGKSVYYLSYVPWLVVNAIFSPFTGWGHCESNIESDEGKEDLLNE